MELYGYVFIYVMKLNEKYRIVQDSKKRVPGSFLRE
jgi:hypothetical protein